MLEQLLQGEVLATGGAIWAIMLALKKSGLIARFKWRTLVYHLVPLLLGVGAGLGGFIQGETWQSRVVSGLLTALVVGKLYDGFKSPAEAVKRP